MTKTALILVDFQNERFNENSDWYIGDREGVIEKINKLLAYARGQDMRIIFTRHIEIQGTTFIEGSPGAELFSGLDRRPEDSVITKHKISPFYQTSLEQELAGVGEVWVCGILTNLCVRSLIHDLYDREFTITVVTDCCAALDEQTHLFTLKDLKETREEIEFTQLEELQRSNVAEE